MREKVGLSPGVPIYTGVVEVKNPEITIIKYDQDDVTAKHCDDYTCAQEIFSSIDKKIPTWIHVEPISDQETIAVLCESFNIHPLVIEDILSVSHRPKAEEYEEYIFTILKYIEYDEDELKFSQISLILHDDYLLTFADYSPDRFEVIKKRIEKKDSRMRKEGNEYLYFALIDYLIDQYFIVLEKIGDKIEDIEDEILNSPTKQSIQNIHDLKRTLVELKKSVWPMRELINTILLSDSIGQKHQIYFKDTHDHVINIIDIIEGYRDSVSGFLDIYLSTLSNRMNEIMKTLSIIATIFIPLSFLTGYFGMNFKYETIFESQNAYYFSNILMIIVPIGLLTYFKLRRWF
ncbi:magnesium/cobalt transporter CorA [bacterium]|nr:magnesium/cobalt transporter CorA [bacterium]MBU1882897.1 magnesium/cobalt transporter CorA [bacterium]